MPNAEKIDLLSQEYPQLKNISDSTITVSEEVKTDEAERLDSSFTLLKRFLKELQTNNDDFVKMYNREVM